MAKKKKAENLVGKVVVMNKLEKKFLDNFIQERKNGEIAFEMAAQMTRHARDGLWQAILDFHPEVEGYHSNYNSLTGAVTVVGKKREKIEPDKR